MELSKRNQSVTELSKRNNLLVMTVAALSISLAAISVRYLFQSEIVIVDTPGLPHHSIIERSNFDKGAQMATLVAVTNNLAQVNPGNAEYQKLFLQSFLSPTAYSKISAEIDTQAAKLLAQRELGSYYYAFKSYFYDPQLDKHFVLGDLHTVNAAKDSSEPYVFEYKVHVENYRMWIDDVKTYAGDKPHNADWLKAAKK